MNFNRTIFISADTSGCGWIRSFLPARYLNGNFQAGFHPQMDISLNDNYIFQRSGIPDMKRLMHFLKEHGKKVYYDLDDDLWTIDHRNPAHLAYTPEVLAIIEEMISLSDIVFTSTVPLQNKLTKYNPDVRIVPNLIELPHGVADFHSKIRIGYAGSASHVIDFSDKLVYQLKKLFSKYNSKIEFMFIGYCPPELKDYALHVAPVEVHQYLELLQWANFDIALIPLADTEFNLSKSNLKWLDSAICKAVPVATNIYPYNEIVDGENGYKIYDEKWFDTLEMLINDEIKRKEVAEKAYNHVLNEYTWMNASHKQSDVYKLIGEN